MKLISDWQQGWKFWSVRLQALGAALLTFSLAVPDYAVQALATLPVDIRASIAPDIAPELVQYIALEAVIAGLFARYIKQHKLAESKGATNEF